MTAAPGQPASVDMSSCVSYGIEELKKNPGFQILASLVILLINSCTGGLLYGPLMVGYYRALKKEEQGQTPELGDVFSGFDVFLPSFLVSLLGGIAVGIAACLCIVPMFFVLPIIPAALLLVTEGEKDGIQALKTAFEPLKANLVPAGIAALVLCLIGAAGSILCG